VVSALAATALLAALVPASVELRTPGSRSDNVTAIGSAVRAAGRPGDGLVYLPGSARVLTAAYPEDTRVLTDLALAQDAVSSDTLAGVELPARTVAARIPAFDRIVAVRAGSNAAADQRDEAKKATLRRCFDAHATTEAGGAYITVYVRRHHGCLSGPVRRDQRSPVLPSRAPWPARPAPAAGRTPG
jgi:mannosyltransferase